MRVLVTGAAGFIGSTTAELLLDLGHEVVALDNLTSGAASNVPARADFVAGDCGDQDLVGSLGRFDACVHFAAFIEPSQSMSSPERFFANNVGATFELLETLVAGGTSRFVFSSSCAVYGDRSGTPFDESSPTRPHSPYGESKLMVESALRWLAQCGRLRAASLRYFNAAGATPAHPERHLPETHLIPIAFEAAVGQRSHLEIFGDDYATPDGTCIRDYVHVSDLALAHARAIDALESHDHLIVNLGTGVGSSNLEVVDAVKRVSGTDFEVRIGPRRPGDSAAAVASNTLARDVLHWVPERSDLDRIVADAWAVVSSS